MSAEWIRTAKVGDKVVCVDDRQNNADVKLEHVTFGQQYVIRSIGIEDRYDSEPAVSFWLDGVRRDLFWRGEVVTDFGFRADRFRPVQPRKTDISVFTALLTSTPTHKPVRENA